MALKVEILALAMLLMALAAHAQNGVFDLTKYNPKADIAELQVEGTVKAPAEPKGESWVTFQQIDGFTLSGKGTFNGQGHIAWGNNNCHQNPACKKFPINLRFNFVSNAMIKDVTTEESKTFHVNVLGCKNITFQNFKVVAPAESPNTDGIHIGRSEGVYIVDSPIGTGDDCISIGDGAKQIHITGVTCGPGHGISIGSLGKYDNEEPVIGIFVKNCTLRNTDNGVRIKSWPAMKGGLASDIHFEDIIIDNVSNPVIVDQEYCPWNQCSLKEPSKVKLSKISFKNIRGTSNTPVAVKIVCSSGIPCEEVDLADINLTYSGNQGPAKSECKNAKIKVTGTLNPPEKKQGEMALKVEILAIAMLLMALAADAQNGVFDLTKYNPKADIAEALLAAWKEACASTTPSKVLIPAGEYLMGPAELLGPCKAPIELQVEGTVKAPAEPKGESWVTFQQIDGFTLSGKGTFNGQGHIAWGNNNCHQNPACKKFPINLRFNFVSNAMIKDVTTEESKTFHVNVLGCKNITFQNFKVVAPAESPNTDGIHIGRSEGVYIVDSPIGTGDDCISIGDGAKQIHITGVTCGPGHGISIGSLGKYDNEEPVIGIFVKNCTLRNTDNGVRIKSWPAMKGGLASDIHFEDIIIDNVSNPVIVDQEYCPWNQCSLKEPSKVKLSKISFKNIRGTSNTPVAVKIVCSSGIPCEEVDLADINLTYSGNQGPAKSECKNAKIKVTGTLNPPGC
ncbi:hypothetical protein Tsubulata_015805 [Turnera subulata]|uniref:Polygalacturonase n=1 Tax=Turnera subulata TaxID=218843 RepID=A0A9Q0FA76_9ROSI|nr:hypothetical protein Tsubulata_015805 [Turnera subulata]